MRYQETENGIAKYDDSGKLIGIYSKSDPNVKEWRQQQGASQRRSTNRNTSSAIAKNTTTTTKPKYSEPIGPKPQAKSTPTKTTQRPATQIQAQRSNQNVGYQNYNRPWEQKLPEYARPGEQQRMLEKRTQPEFKKIRDSRDSVERGRQEVERVMLRKDRNGLPASTFDEQQFHDTSDIIIEMERLKTNPRDYYQKVDELGIDKANEWYRKNKNPYGMKKYDEFSRQADWAENVSPKEFYKTIGEMAETGTGGNVRQFHEWKNKTNFGDTDNDRMRITLDVGNLSGDKLDKYYEILYNDGMDAATMYAMEQSGYRYTPDSFQDTFVRYINDSVNNSDFDSADFKFKQQMKASAGANREYYKKRIDTLNKYEYMMLNDPDNERKIRAGEIKTTPEKKNAKDIKLTDVLGLMAEDYAKYNNEINTMNISQTERDTYNYLMATSEKDAAIYAQALLAKYQQSEVDKEKQTAYKYAQEHPWMATGENVASSLAAGLFSLPAYASQAVHEKFGGEHIPSDVLAKSNPMLVRKNALQQGVVDNIQSPAGKFLYNAGVSTINNVAGVALYNKYYPLVMAMNAAGEETHSGLERGISKDAALLNGAISGGIEYITEKMFFDDIMDAVTKPISKNSQSVIKNLARASIANTGSEFGEEFVGAIAQNITDSILAGDKSKFNAIVNENIANGMSREEAVQDAFMQSYVWEPLQNGLAGAISGGLLGGGYHYNAMTQAGSAVVNSNIGDAILTRALSAPKGTSTHTAAEAIVKKLQNGERVDNYQYGLLKNAMSEDGVRLTDADVAPTDKLNNVYLKKGGGVAGTVAASRLSWAQYQYLDEIGRAKGKNIIIKDFIGNDVEVDDGNGGKTKVHFTDADNGYYDMKTGDIYISANSENPLLATARHEIFHPYAQTKAGQKYIDKINNIAKKQNKEAYEAKINGIKRMYENRGSREIGDLAREEFAADAAWKMMSRFTDVVRLTNETPSIAQKIKGVVVDLLNTIEGANAKINGVAGSVYDGMTRTQLQNIKRNFEMALGEEVTVDESSGYKKFSLSEVSLKKQIRDNLSALNQMNPVSNVNFIFTDNYDRKANTDRAISILLSKYSKNNKEIIINRDGFGDVNLGKKMLNQSIKYLNEPLEYAAFLALPDVVKKGKLLYTDKNHSSRGYSTYTFGAPVIINGIQGNLAVAVKLTDGYRYKMHRILDIDGFSFNIRDKKTEATIDGATVVENGGSPSFTSVLNNIVSQQKPSVKPKNNPEPDITKALSKSKTKTEPDITKVLGGKKRSFKNNPAEAEATISEMDNVYMDAVRAGDTETAQRMVDEAAKKAGYTVKAYHGTPDARIIDNTGRAHNNTAFTVFNANKSLSDNVEGYNYFATNRKVAEAYAPTVSKGDLWENREPKIYDVYLKTDDFLVVEGNGAAWNEITVPEDVTKPSHYDYSIRKRREYDYANTEYFTKYAKRNGYKGVWFKNIADYNGETDMLGDVYSVFDAEGIKSADPIVYDDNGNIIPLSERFNSGKSDIRYSHKTNPTEANVNMSDKANTNVVGDVEERNITNVLRRKDEKERDITKVLTGRNAELETAVKSKGEYSSDNEIADEDYPDWFFGTPTPTDADAPPVIAQTEAERMLTEMRDAIFKVVGKKITYDNTEIRNIAKNFKKMYKSRASIEKVSTAIAEAYKAVAEVQNTESENIDSDKIKNMIDLSEKAARIIIDSSDSIDRTLWDANKPVRDFIRQNVFRVNESIKKKFPEGGYNSFAEFLKANRGSIRISYTKGTPVDTLYNELVNNFPEWFTDAPSSAEEQLVWIADVLQDMRSTLVQDESGLTYDDKVQMLGSDILSVYTDAVFDIGTQQNIISEIERRKRDSIKRYYSEKYQEKIERDRERKQASEDRQKLLRIAKWLKNKRTSEYYREQIDELIHNLDTESIGFIKKGYDKVVKNPDGTETVTHVMDRLDIEKLAEEYNKLKEENPNFVVNAAVERKIQRLKNRQISDLSIEEVRDLIDVLSNLQTEIMNSDRLIKSKRAERASKIAHDTKKRLAVIKGTGDSAFKSSLSAFLTGHVGAVAAARKFVGYQKDSSFVAVVEEINDGQRKASKIQQEANAIFDNFLKNEKNRKFLADIDKTYKDYGNGVVITPGMKISLALLSENKNAAEHIQGGGMTIPNPKLLKKGNLKEAFYKGKTIQITQEQLIEIAKDLTPQEKEFADLVKKLMNEYSKKKINETSLELYGYELANVTNYFPIRTNKVFIGTEVENLSQNGTLEGMGILKERKPGAYNPLVLESVIDVVNRHINDISKFAGLAIPLRNFKLVYGSASYMPTFEFDNRNTEKITDYSSLQHSLTSTWGSHAKEYFDNLIQDIDTGGRKSDKSYSRILDKVTGNIAKQALLTNLSVVMKQIAAYPTAGAVLGFKPLGQALGHRVTNEDKALYNRITAVMWLREKGYSMKEMSDYMDGPSLSKKVPALLGWIQAVDVNISYKICKAAEMYVNENYNFKKGTPAWEQALADTINKAIEKTQQSSTTMQRAAVLRSPNELVKMFNLFKSQSYLQTELMLDAIGEYNAWREDKKAGRDISDNDIKDSRRRLANVISAQIVASATMSTIGIIYRAAILGRRDWEDEEKNFSMSKLAEALVTSIIKDAAGMIQYGNEISDFVYSMLTGEKYYGIDVATVSLISDAFDGILTITDNAKDIVAVLRGKKQFDINQLLMPTLKSTEKVAAVFGIPMANIRKNVQGVFNLSTAALQKFNPGAAKKIDEAVTNFFYGGTAVFDNRKKEIYEQQKQAPKDYEANYERKKYEKANTVVNTLEKFTDTKRSVINRYVNEYNEAIQNMSLSPEAEKVFKKLYSKLYSEYGQTAANQSLPFYTATQELNVEYGGEKIKYNLNASEYIDYVKKLAKEDLKVFETLAKDEYFLEQSPEVQLKMLKKQRDDAISNFETGIVIDKIGVSADLEAAEKAKIRDKALSMNKTPGKDYVKLGDIYYEVSPETYAKYEKYITAKTQKIIDILKDGTPLNYIDGFEDVYFRDEDGEKIEIDMPLDEYGEIIQGKILDRVKTEVKNSFENELSNQGKTQKIITGEIMNSKYRYYKDNNIVKKIDSGDTSQSAWVRSTDKNIVHEMNEDDYIEEVPIDKSYNIIESARKYIGTPYDWGGTTPKGFDCSGLMQHIFAENGIKINRTAREQFKNGTPVEYKNLKKGDLVFFKGYTNSAANPGHVGLYLGNGQFLHAPGEGDVVKVSDINKRKDYVGARRIIE